MRSPLLALALAASLAGVCPASAQTGRPFTVEDLGLFAVDVRQLAAERT